MEATPTTLHSLPNEILLDLLGLLASSPGHLPYDLPALIAASSKCARVYLAHRDKILRPALQTFLGNFAPLAIALAAEEKLGQFSDSVASKSELEPFISRALEERCDKVGISSTDKDGGSEAQSLPKEIPTEMLLAAAKAHRYQLESLLLVAHSCVAVELDPPVPFHPQLRAMVPFLCEVMRRRNAVVCAYVDPGWPFEGVQVPITVAADEVIEAYALELSILYRAKEYFPHVPGVESFVPDPESDRTSIFSGPLGDAMVLCYYEHAVSKFDYPEPIDLIRWNCFKGWLRRLWFWYAKRAGGRRGIDKSLFYIKDGLLVDLLVYLFFGPESCLVGFREFLLLDNNGRDEWMDDKLEKMLNCDMQREGEMRAYLSY